VEDSLERDLALSGFGVFIGSKGRNSYRRFATMPGFNSEGCFRQDRLVLL
jgi:hypothetical protein